MAISRSQMERQLRNMGGIMSLEDPRQGYFLGKLVRKAKKAVKKVVKSPIGKAAILAGGAGLLGGVGPFAGLRTSGLGKLLMGSKLSPGFIGPVSGGQTGILQKFFLKDPRGGFSLGNLLGKGLTNKGLAAGIGGVSGLAGLLAAQEAEDEDSIDISDIDRGEGLNILDIVARARKNDPEFRFLPPVDFQNLAEGGGVGSLAMNKENVKQKFVSDEAGAIPKKGGGVTPDDMGKLKQSDFDSEEDYQRYLRQLNRKARGGITELDAGAPDIKLKGDVKPENMKMARSNMMNKRRNALDAAFDAAIDEYMSINAVDVVPMDIQNAIFKSLQRKMLGRAEGGLMDLGGMEMDLRGGGFVPLGAKEKADDVPARLSKNEFVMTADAVRAAGGGSVDKGADKMYNLMKNLESRV